MSRFYYRPHNYIIAHLFSLIAHFDSIIAHFDSIIAQLGSITAHFFSIIAQISPVSAISIPVRYFNLVSVTSQTDDVKNYRTCRSHIQGFVCSYRYRHVMCVGIVLSSIKP
jgi:hypothetical protein